MRKMSQIKHENKISIVIITKDRKKQLSECFASLFSQSYAPDEIIVVDNSLSHQSKKLIVQLKKIAKFPILYFTKRNSNFGILRNEGLRRASYEWVAFIDDDCVADVNWLRTMKQAISETPFTVVIGESLPYFSQNLPSLTTNFLDLFWKQKRISSEGRILDFEITDTKNLLVNRTFLKQQNILFQENLAWGGRGEDCLLGLNIQRAGAKGFYHSAMKIWHKDVQDWRSYYHKLYQETRAYHLNVRTQKNSAPFTTRAYRKIHFLNFFFKYVEEKKITKFQAIGMIFHVFLSVCVIKSLRTIKTL